MPAYYDVDDHRGYPRADPATWPEVATSMAGFEFPHLGSCRALRTSPAVTDQHDPDLLILGEGHAYYLQRRIMKSLFGAVFHGVQGSCRRPNDPFSYQAPPIGQQRHVAVKRSSLGHMRRSPQENIFREISVMRYLSEGSGHPNVLPLLDACMTSTHIYVVTPYCAGGDMLSHIVPQEGLPQHLARQWFRQILLGVGYIHSKGLCHHDLSPENIVINESGSAAIVMDLGMVQRIPMSTSGEPLPMRDVERFSKLRYMAPEIYSNEEYDGRQADIWSVGATLLVCISGDYPWEAPTRLPSPADKIFHSDIYHYSDLAQFGATVMLTRMDLVPPRISGEAFDLLCTMLVVDRSSRPRSASVLAEHPFCTNHSTLADVVT